MKTSPWTLYGGGLVVALLAVGSMAALASNARACERKAMSTEGRATHTAMAQSRPFLGIQMQPMTPDLREFFSAPKDSGVLVSSVVEDSPAAAAGLISGDVILKLGDVAIATPRDIVRMVRSKGEGATLVATILRQGKSMTLSATLAANEVDVYAGMPGHRFMRQMAMGGTGELLERLKGFEERLKKLEEK